MKPYALCLLVLISAPATGLAASARPALIDPSNIDRLAIAWTYDTGDSVYPIGGRGKPPAFEATPVYSDGRLYLSSPQGTVAALNAETGAQIWRVDLQVLKNANYSDPANRGPTLRGKRLYVGTVDGRLVCLQIRDGRRCTRFAQNGEIDLSRGLRHKPQWAGEYGVTSQPAVIRNLVIVGSSVADNSRAQMASGEVRAFDAVTGELRWTFHPLPENSSAGGANAWSRITVDEARDLIFVPTGSPSPDYYGGLRPGRNDYANSIVALKAQSGAVAWHFQTVHHDLWDYDVPAAPLLFPHSAANNAVVSAVAVASKTGHVFLFDRTNGVPLFPIIERTVPASDVPGEQAFPTQPFPTKPASLAPQSISESDIAAVTPADREACLRTLRSLRNEGIFTPPSLQGSLLVPGNVGGMHWGGMAYDSKHELLIAPVNHLPSVSRLIPRAEFNAARRAFPSRETTEQTGTPYGMSREFFFAPSGVPCVAPPWGELVAIHADTGEIAWRSALGDLRELVASRAPADLAEQISKQWNVSTGSVNLGGPATTETGLVFIGAALDPYLRAFNTANGKEVWQGKLPTSARAVPLVYTTKRGRQMIAVAAGGHDISLSKIDTKLVVFALTAKDK